MASLAALRIDESIGRPAADESGLPADRLIALSSLSWPLASAGLPLAVLLPAIYAQHYGISLAALGGLFLLSRFWDAANDPLIGILSDRTRSRWGRRKPWIAAGAPVFGLSAFLLFFPQGPVTPLSRGVVLFFFYLGWTMIQIPFSAWTGELSRAYHERTRIQTFLHVSTATTLFVALLIPTFLDQVRPDDAQLKLAAMGVLVLGSLLVSVPLALRAFPEPELPDTPAERPGLAATVRAAAADGLLLRVLASDFAVTLGQTIRASLIVFYISFYMGRPDWGAGLYLLQFSFGIFAGPLWLKLGRRLGKHRTAVAGEVVQIAINLALLLVTPDAFGLLLALTVAQGLAQGSGKALLLGHFVKRFVGLSQQESNLLLGIFQAHVTKPENTVRWRWKAGDVAIWDNRATQHRAIADFGRQPRHLRRATLNGTPAVALDGSQSRVIKPSPALAVAAE